MKFQETGRFGRITKHLRRLGFENKMADILYDSICFPQLCKTAQTKYVESVVDRMIRTLGQENTDKVLFECGAQCCGKSWSDFAKRIWGMSTSIDDFFVNLNKAEEKYNTHIMYSSDDKIVTIERSQCICGLINKGLPFDANSGFCKCSLGHMSVFFNTVLSVKTIQFEKSISSGADKCRWKVELQKKV